MNKILFLIIILSVNLYATSITDFIDLKKCDQIIDKQVFKICYSYKYKGPLAVWYELDGTLVNKINIKDRPKFYSEKNIPVRYRSKYKDYTHSGFDRGHLAPDASFDYDQKILRKTYSMANIVPQYPKLNRYTWIKAEKYERYVASKMGQATVINLVDYSRATQQIGKNKITVPNTFYKIIFNDQVNFKKCFKYENIKNNDTKKDELRNHLIDC
jgi:endonuclease G